MFDSLTNSADGLFIIFYIIALVLFFLVGPHKVYEGIFGSLIALGCYIFFYEITFVQPEITRTVFLGSWLIDHRGTLLWITKMLSFALLFVTPMTLGVSVSGVVRGTGWFFFKILILSAFFICFGTVIFDMLYETRGFFGQVTLFPGRALDNSYLQNSSIYGWIVGHSYALIFWGFLLSFYKILFSHWVSRFAVIGGILYVKGNQIFGKKTFDPIIHDDHAEAVSHDDDHAHAHDAHH